MRVRVIRVLHAKLYASEILYENALPGSTARQLFNSSTLLDSWTARQNSTELDRARQTSTPRRMQSASTCLDGLDSYSTATRQLLDSYSTATRQLLDRLDRQGLDSPSTAASTAARRSLDSSTARQPGLKFTYHGHFVCLCLPRRAFAAPARVRVRTSGPARRSIDKAAEWREWCVIVGTTQGRITRPY